MLKAAIALFLAIIVAYLANDVRAMDPHNFHMGFGKRHDPLAMQFGFGRRRRVDPSNVGLGKRPVLDSRNYQLGFGKRAALVHPYELGSGDYYDSLNYIAGLGK